MERASERTKAQSVGPTTVCQRRRAATHTDMQGRSQPQGSRSTSCHDHSDPRDFRKSDVKLQKQKVDYLAIATASCSSRGEKQMPGVVSDQKFPAAPLRTRTGTAVCSWPRSLTVD